jgi:hypothetical protein
VCEPQNRPTNTHSNFLLAALHSWTPPERRNERRGNQERATPTLGQLVPSRTAPRRLNRCKHGRSWPRPTRRGRDRPWLDQA